MQAGVHSRFETVMISSGDSEALKSKEPPRRSLLLQGDYGGGQLPGSRNERGAASVLEVFEGETLYRDRERIWKLATLRLGQVAAALLQLGLQRPACGAVFRIAGSFHHDAGRVLVRSSGNL